MSMLARINACPVWEEEDKVVHRYAVQPSGSARQFVYAYFPRTRLNTK